MTSINTNIAATTALRTLQQTNSQLDQTQSRISTGLKIGSAKDNAAYWSISTALKSDNKAMATVKDALGLGAATVDTAYQGLNAAKNVLDEIKSKLTAATQTGVDKNVIQAEIAELQKQLQSIANSSIFSGENWLSVNSETAGFSADKQIVASFTRDASNNVSIGTVNVNIGAVALFDSSTVAGKNGILDAQVELKTAAGAELKVGGVNATGNGTASGGIPAAGASDAGSDLVAATQGTLTSAVFGLTGAADGDDLLFSISIDGETPAQDFVIDITDASTFDIDDVVAGMSALTGATVAAGTGPDAGKLIITSNSTGVSSTVTISGAIVAADGGNTAKAGASTTLASGETIVDGEDQVDATAAAVTLNAFAAFELDADDSVTFKIAIDGAATPTTVRIDQALVNETLGEAAEGKIATLDEYRQVVAAALTKANVSGVTVAANAGDTALVFTSGTEGDDSAVAISDVVVSAGADRISVDTINISEAALTASGATTGEQVRDVLSAYISVVNDAINKVTSAASNLGAVASRIELQQTFVTNLMDTIDQGVSGLVDADMNEESTRLQALQVKQQLGVQALSIANQSAQNVLRLFQ